MTLPDQSNLVRWGKGTEKTCYICGKAVGTARHLLVGCKVLLDSGQYSRRHDRVLEIIREAVSLSVARAQKGITTNERSVGFVREGTRAIKTNVKPYSILKAATDWTIMMDTCEKQYKIPEDICASASRPDIFMYSRILKRVVMIELTVPWETNIPKDHTIKVNKYYELTNELTRNRFVVDLYAVEVGARGITAKSLYNLLKDLGLSRTHINSFLERTSKAALVGSFQIWLGRERSLDSGAFHMQEQNFVKDEQRKKPQSVRDLLKTGSCIPAPYRCPHPKMQYYLYTRTTQEKGELLNTLDNDSLTRSRFNTKHPTKVVVHGFGGGRNLSPSTDMRNAYFARGNYNIIIVDYGSLVKEPCLSQIEWAPRFAATCITQLVEYLQYHPKKAVPPEKIHTIGYSVGAHILGLVANHLSEGKLGRITGLDPTIFFYMGNNRSRDLDYTDAHFVDILHTGAGILGQWGPNGHADFYVNGGSSQPGCAHDTIFQTLSCDHTKVTPYFIESITSPVGFWAGPCPNLFSYLIGWCEPKDTEYVLMGEHVTHKARGVYYVTTNANPPYARGFPGKNRKLRSISPYS
nr:uncharacterized protein LOC116768606 [Danaus plexippus plexippus]